jgi:hypothetical protein
VSKRAELVRSRESELLPIRPSAYAWRGLVKVGFIGAVPSTLIGAVLVLRLQTGWPVLAGFAFASLFSVSSIASLIQHYREADLGYTTLPSRAGELELRDPTDGATLIPAGSGVRFDSLKQARRWSASTPATGPNGNQGEAPR